jgi:hypothetical protein
MDTKVKWLIIVIAITGAILLLGTTRVRGLMGMAEPMWDRPMAGMMQENQEPAQADPRMSPRMYACLPMTDRKHRMGFSPAMMMQSMAGQNTMGRHCGTMPPMMGSMMHAHRHNSMMDRK